MKSLSNPLEIVRGMTSSVVLVFGFVGKDRVCSSDIALTKKAPVKNTPANSRDLCGNFFTFITDIILDFQWFDTTFDE